MVHFAGVHGAGGAGGAVRKQQAADREKMGSDPLEWARMRVTKKEASWFFAQGDVNNDGIIDRGEARALLDSIKMIPDPAFVSSDPDNAINTMWVKKLDDDEFDMIFKLACRGQQQKGVERKAIVQLLTLHRALSRYRHVINAVFERYDTNKDGFLDAAELADFVLSIDSKASPAEVDVLCNKLFEVDKDGDRRLSRAELLAAIGLWRAVVAEAREAATLKKLGPLPAMWHYVITCQCITEGNETYRTAGIPKRKVAPESQTMSRAAEETNAAGGSKEGATEQGAPPVIYVLPADVVLEVVEGVPVASAVAVSPMR